MNNSFSVQQIQKTNNLDANLISRQYKLNLMADFMRLKYENPKMEQSEIGNHLCSSASTIQRYKNDINMLSSYRIQSNNISKRIKKVKKTNSDNDSQPNHDDKRPQMTSNDLKTTQTKSNKKNKNVLKAGSVQQNIEFNEHYLDEILHDKNSQMELTMQIISNDKTVRNDTVQDLKEFNSQSLATQAKKGEQLVTMMPANRKAFNLLGDNIVEISTENDALKNKIGSYDEKWLEESKARMLQQIDDEKRTNLIMSRMKKQMNK